MTALFCLLMVTAAPPDTVKTLQTVSVSVQSSQQTELPQASVTVDAAFIEEHLGQSLAHTLEAIPGVKAQSIGAGLSKPSIRGMDGNRMVVSLDGVKHEGQQWGDDHGLEVDQFAVDEAEVVKGPAALLYGSDALGGVISLTGSRLPASPLEASATLFGRGDNGQLGLAARLAGRRGGFFYKANLTVSDYGDMRVPADSVVYYSYVVRLRDGRLRNTAGCERDGRLMLGWTNNENFRTDLSVSDVFAHSGFFADAHGLEVRLSTIGYDLSTRDVDLPSQWVNHLKAQSRTTLRLGSAQLEASLAWQHNLREELSEPLSHGYMPTPPDSLERRFDKHTFSGSLGATLPLGDRHEAKVGFSGERQRNRRDGWGFILPDFESSAAGFYATDLFTASPTLALSGGLRYDVASISIHPYRDWYLTPGVGGDSLFVLRSSGTTRRFGSLTWSVGANWHAGGWVVRVNAGKAFRVPIAKELGADGVNYHIFRYEQGNAGLDPERSYQLDAGVGWSGGGLTLKADPWLNYFPNYIYLNPTPYYEEGLQLYRYTQARVLRGGVEVEASWRFGRRLEASLAGQVCRSRQLSGDKRGYTLPFAVPPSADAALTWHYDWHGRGSASVGLRAVAAQSDIVPPEKPTPAHATLSLALAHRVACTAGSLALAVRVDNLLGTRYYDHTSYYRLVDIPEPGRVVSVNIKYEFKQQEKETDL